MMEAAQLRKCVWQEMLLADMRSRFFAGLVRHYSNLDRGIRVFVLLASSSAIATALPDLPAGVKLIAPIAAAAASFWLLLSNYTTMSRDAADLHIAWGEKAKAYERLFNDLGSADAEARFHQIHDSADALSKSGTKFPRKKRQLDSCLTEAEATAFSRYA